MSVSTAPKGPTDLSGRSWWGVLRRTATEFNQDSLGDWAAALTYRAVMSIFPLLVVLIAVLGLLGPSATQTVTDTITQLVPGQGRDLLLNAVRELQSARGIAGPVAVLGLIVALWSASGYVASFMRASNAIYEVDEGRPVWKTWPLRLGVTVVVVALLAACAVGVIATGALADRLGRLLGIGSTGVLIWEIAKWPVIAVLVSLVFTLLYWVSPNVRLPGFRWITPGGLLAVVVWALASGGFALYIANFGSYNKTYGSLAGVIVFLVWLWLTNAAILLGAELDAELIRGRQLAAGQRDEEPFLPPRDTRAADLE